MTAGREPDPFEVTGGAPHTPPATLDEELLCCLGPAFPPLVASDPERIHRIESESAEGFSRLAGITKAVSFFGSGGRARS